ncbi:hypothetical protein [Paludibaculum fermentans]|uniref:hypothetical protein n=1 Tax=Paludibaculum fermentans TaxID=1473598 RepID=UPI003EBDE74A
MRWSLGLCVLAFPLLASDVYVPAVTTEAIDGQAQRVQLRIRNAETRPVQLTFQILPLDDATPPSPATRSIEPTSTVDFADALAALFPDGSPAGTLKISADGAILVSAQRFFDKEGRTYGLPLPEVTSETASIPGAVLDAPWLPTSSERTSAVWISLDGEAEATLLAYDPAGKELARRKLTGAGKTFRLTPADLTADPPSSMRIKLLTAKGLFSVFVETALASTGDRSGYPAVEVAKLPKELSFLPALRLPFNGTFASTSVVLFNPWAADLPVTFTLRGVNKRVTVPPLGMLEVADPISTLFGMEEGVDVLFASASYPFFALAANDIRPDAAGAVMASDLRLFTDPDDTPGPGDVAYLLLPVVDGAQAFFALTTRAEDFTGTLQLEDSAGLPSGTPITYTLPSSTLQIQALADTLPGAGSGSAFSVIPGTGPAQMGLPVYLPGSNDPLWVGARTATASTACEPPYFSELAGSAYTLSAAGPVTLTWSAAGADSVELQPSGDILAASGSLVVNVTAATQFTFRAANACATVEQSFRVSVGPAVVSSVSAGPRGSVRAHGAPGELLTVSFENLTEPELIDSLVVSNAAGVSVPVKILARGAQGEIFALVPLIMTGADTAKVFSGDVTVQAALTDGKTTAGVNFTIDSAVYDGNPVAGFTALVDDLAAWTRETSAQWNEWGLAGSAALEANAAREEADLRQMLAGIAASGQATLSYNHLPLTNAEAIAVPVKASDLAVLLAYNRNAGQAWRSILGATETETPAAASARLAGSSRLAGTCLATKVPLLSPCLANDFRKKFNDAIGAQVDDLFQDFDKEVPNGRDALVKWLKKKLAQKAVNAAARRIQAWLNYLSVACLVAPIELSDFRVETQGRLITASPRRNRALRDKEVLYSRHDNLFTVVRVIAVLVPEIPIDKVRSKARSLELEAFRKGLQKAGVKKETADLLASIFDKTLDSDPVLDELVKMAQAYANKTKDEQQVGACDLVTVYPKKNGSGRAGNPDQGYKPGVSVLKLYTGRVQGEDDYFFIGKRINRSDLLCIVPIDRHFLFSQDAQRVEKQRISNNPCAFSEQLTVTRRADSSPTDSARRPSVYSDRVYVGPGEALALVANAAVGAPGTPGEIATPPIITVNVNAQLDQDNPYVRQAGGGISVARIEARQTGDLTWTLDLKVSGHQEPIQDPDGFRHYDLWTAYSMLDVYILFPTPPRDQPRKVKMSAKSTSDDICQMPIILASDQEIKSSTSNVYVSANSLDFSGSGTINQLRTRMHLYVPNRGFGGPFEPRDTSCQGNAKIEVVEPPDEPPPAEP